MKLKLGGTTSDFFYYAVTGILIAGGLVYSLVNYVETAIIYMLLAIVLIPRIEYRRGFGWIADIFALITAPLMALYFDHLITMYDHGFFEEYHSIIKYLFFLGKDSSIFLPEVFIVLIIFTVLRALFVPVKVAAPISCGVPMLFSLTDFYVYTFRGNEFIPSDFYGIRTALNVAGHYSFPIVMPFFFMILPFALYVTFFVRMDIPKPSARYRISVFVIAFFTSACLIMTFNDYMKKVADTHDVLMWGDEATEYNGFVTNFLVTFKSLKVGVPAGYDPVNMSNVNSITRFDNTDTSNIIVILNESYTDMGIYHDYFGDFEEPAPYWQSLTDNARKGNAYVSVYGGRTPNSEFEVLTGLPVGALPAGSIPFAMYMNKDIYSMPYYLKENGYSTFAMHPYYSNGWSRTTAYPHLGIEDMYFIEDLEYDDSDLVRDYMSDMCAYENLITRLEATEGPKFAYLVTMQNHGGYDMGYDNFDVTEYVSTDNEELDFQVNTFMSLVRKSDEALEYLIDYLSDQDEKYTLLIFGDHQPSLDFEANYDIGGDKWVVPYLIWTNYDMPESLAGRVDTTASLNYLSLDVLEAAEVPFSPYYEYISDIRHVVPRLCASGYFSIIDSSWHGWDDRSADKGAIDRYFSLRYYSLFERRR